MKKSSKKLLILLASLISILISASIYEKIKFQTIFDEIYYDSRNASGESFDRRSSLGDIKGMSASAANLSSERERIIVETYNSEGLCTPMKRLSIMNNSTKKRLHISFSYQVTSDITIFFANEYNVKEKILTRKISFVELTSGERFTTDRDVGEMVSRYSLTEKQLNAWYKQGMNDVFLKDWVSVYPSSYSPDNLGNVKIKTQW